MQLTPDKPIDTRPDLDIAQVAEATQTHHMTIRRAIDRQLIRAYRIGRAWRIPAAELERIRRDGLAL